MNNKENIIDKCKQVNEEFKNLSINCVLILVGGASFILNDLLPRITFDQDYINKQEKIVEEILNRYDFNSRAKNTYELTYGEWKKDIKLLETYSNLKLYTISTERLIASRLFGNYRLDDFEVAFLNSNMNQNKFEKIVKDIFMYCDPIFIGEFYQNKAIVKKAYEEKGWKYENSIISKLYEKKS